VRQNGVRSDNARKWFAIAPFIQYALRDTSPVLGSAIKPESPGQIELLEAAVEYGFRSGIVVPVHEGIKARVGVLYLGSSGSAAEVEPHLLQNKNLVRAIALELYEWWNATIQAEAIWGLRLDDLDLELLRMEHEGFTAAEAARELGLSRSRVNNRFRRINMKLKVSRKKLAAEKAIELGLLRL
jgi:DNA-binding CsgD family transcriptional regulator